MTEKLTEFGLGKTDFCHNCVFYAPYPANDPIVNGTCRANPPTHSGFPDVYAKQWCASHRLTAEARDERLRQFAKGCSDNLRADGLCCTLPGEIVIIPAVQAGKPAQKPDILSDDLSYWDHYPDVDGL